MARGKNIQWARIIAGLGLLLALQGGCALPGDRLPPTARPATMETRAPIPSPSTLPTYTLAPTSTPWPTHTPLTTLTQTAAPTLLSTSTPQPSATARLTPSSTSAPPTLAPSATRTLPPPTATPVPTPAIAMGPRVDGLVITPEDTPRLLAVFDNKLYGSVDYGTSWRAEDIDGLPVDARILCVAVDYRQPSVMYLGAEQGIFRREGSGAWAFVHTLRATALAVDLIDAHVLWAGTGFTTEYNAILLKSEDAGRTWGRADYGMSRGANFSVSSILIDPQDPNILYANVRYPGRFGWPLGWVYRGGRNGNWGLISPDYPEGEGACLCQGMAFDPNLRRLYIGCYAYYYNQGSLLLHYTDNAHAPHSAEIRWQALTTLPPAHDLVVYGGTRALAVDAGQIKSLYVFLSYDEGRAAPFTPQRGLWVSHDDGQTWERLSLP